MKKIGMISAMLEEGEKVSAWLGKAEKTDLYGNFCIKKYIKNDCEIYFVSSGVGEILASISTQILISKYNVEMIINFGLCGSLVGLGLAQMCVVESVVHYDFDISALEGTEVGRYSRFPSALIPTDKSLVDLVCKLDTKIQKVVCASADKFVADEKIKKDLSTRYGAQICEMESAGILITSIENCVPALFIKVVSDTKDHAEEFNDFLERNNFEFVKILEKILRSVA